MKRFNLVQHCLYLLQLGKIYSENQYQAETNKQKMADSSHGGFTLIEALVVILMMGVLAAIAAPGWISFVNRQRLNVANDAVARAIQKAQREAKTKGVGYSIQFDTAQDPPKFAVYPTGETPTAGNWERLGESSLQKNQIKLFTPNGDTITFDYQGAIDKETTSVPVAVTVSLLNLGGNNKSTPKRCVIVETLLAGMRTADGDDCPTK